MPVVRQRTRRDTAANWTSNDPVLGLGEQGVETDTSYSKTGDGSTAWSSLPYDGAPADRVTVTPSGLVVITTTDVQAALAELDAWTQTVPAHTEGDFSAIPSIGAVPDGLPGATYLATDQNGGTLYQANATVWTKVAPGATETSGLLATVEHTAGNIPATGVPAAVVALELSDLTIGARPIVVEFISPYVTSGTLPSQIGVTLHYKPEPAGTPETLITELYTPLVDLGIGGTSFEGVSVRCRSRPFTLTPGDYSFVVKLGSVAFPAHTHTHSASATRRISHSVFEV